MKRATFSPPRRSSPWESALHTLRALFFLLSPLGCAASNAGLPLDYRVGPYQEYATEYTFQRPRGAARSGGPSDPRSPVVVVLHGGFWDDGGTDEVALGLRQRHIVAVVPTYRGEKRRLDGKRSQGAVEFCAGEIEDVVVLLRALRSRPDIDPDRIALLGFSHGGCVALRVAAIDPRLAAVVAFSAPIEAAYTDRFLREHPFGMLGFAGWLRGEVESFVGATPDQAPEAWRLRSPLYVADSLRQPLVLVQGTDDALVPAQETCMLRDALHTHGRPIAEGYFEPNGAPDRTPVPVCSLLPRLAESSREQGPAVQIWYFEGEGHVFSKDAQNAALNRAADFLVRELHPSWASASGPAR
jgi:dipeptidyl aminopeptidase/acylaminoacyl peptidase